MVADACTCTCIKAALQAATILVVAMVSEKNWNFDESRQLVTNRL